MDRLSYAQIVGELTADRLAGLPAFEVAVLRNVVLEPLEPYLRHGMMCEGFNALCRFGGYDNVFQEAVDGRPDLLNERTNAVLVFLKLETLSWSLARNFASMTPNEVENEMDRVKGFATRVVSGIRRQTDAMILCGGFETPLYPSLGIADQQQSNGQCDCISTLNQLLKATLRAERNAYFLDLNACVSRVGARRFYDARYWHMARVPYSREGLEELAHELLKFIRPSIGRNRKCLVLDCDNVLWGGIAGEDGLAGIRLGGTYPGSPFVEFQQEVLALHNRGVVLALCSKNNESDVWEIFDRHPDMLLRREHIATAQINWRDKASNLKQIASDLNLGLDSLVFVDDSPFEIEQVRMLLPQVKSVLLPAKHAVEYRDLIASGGWFDSPVLTGEDRQRGNMYRAEAARKALHAETDDLSAYLASLEMRLEIRLADAFSIPRIAQLTQKTNQFNLTTRRYSVAQLEALSNDPSTDVIFVRLWDRFGDSGITGVCIMKYVEECALIDSLLLSCRILGRGVEDALLVRCLQRARLRACRTVVGEYVPTAKNEQVKDFYLRLAFTKASDLQGILRFELDLEGFNGVEPVHFAAIDSHLGQVPQDSSLTGNA